MIYVYNNIYIYQAKAGSGVFFLCFFAIKGQINTNNIKQIVFCVQKQPQCLKTLPCRSMGVERCGFSRAGASAVGWFRTSVPVEGFRYFSTIFRVILRASCFQDRLKPSICRSFQVTTTAATAASNIQQLHTCTWSKVTNLQEFQPITQQPVLEYSPSFASLTSRAGSVLLVQVSSTEFRRTEETGLPGNGDLKSLQQSVA